MLSSTTCSGRTRRPRCCSATCCSDVEPAQAARARHDPRRRRPPREELTDLLARLYRDPAFERIALRGPRRRRDRRRSWPRRRARRPSELVRRCALHEGTEAIRSSSRRRCAACEVPATRASSSDALSRVAVPEGVKELIGTRLARLSETANHVLTVASVVGREFRLEVLEALIDEPVERIISALEEADDAGLVREVADDADRFVFTHALVRETLYERQSASRRVRLHYRIARGARASGTLASPPSSPTTTSRAATSTARARRSTTRVQAAARRRRALAYEEAADALRGARWSALPRRRAAALRAAARPRQRGRAAGRPGAARDVPRAAAIATRERSARAAGARGAGGFRQLAARRRGRSRGDRAARGRARGAGRRREPARRAAAREPGQRAALRGDARARARRSARGRSSSPAAAAIRSRWSTALESRHTALLAARQLDRAAALATELYDARRAHRRARAEDARPALAHLRPARAGRHRRRPPRVACAARARRRAAPAASTATSPRAGRSCGR